MNHNCLLKTFLLYLIFISASLAGCKNEDPVSPPNDTIPEIPGWTLVWNDEFNGETIDASKWSHEVNGDGGGNNELQYYTDFAENSYIENGSLIIKALKKNYLGKEFTSARMRTLHKGDWTYGRFDIRAKLPYGKGLWPAIWMLPTDWVYGGWPTSGEIDIMELLGHEPNKVYGTIHYGPAWPNNQHSGGSYILPSSTFASDYHLFTVEWDSTEIRWFVDGDKYHTEVHGQPFDKRFHLLLNVAVGGNWPGSPDFSTTFPQKMSVDYVRVYKKAE
ncbi:MAG: glycoside hydrolase family 16 protein [Ignavibacteriaceae bacterium]